MKDLYKEKNKKLSNFYSGFKHKNIIKDSVKEKNISIKEISLNHNIDVPLVKKNQSPATKEWVNSVYSFNPNYIKPLTMADIMINKLVRGYFNFVKLIWKRKYKRNTPMLKNKFKLIKRRKKAEIKKNKLSLNKIFISKGEMKHTNNKVIATFYIYNKTKKYLMYKLNSLYETFPLLNLNNSNKKDSKDVKSYISNKGKNNNITSGQKINIPLNLPKIKGLDISKFRKRNSNNIKNIKQENYVNKEIGLNTQPIKNLYNHVHFADITKKRLSLFISKIGNTDIKNKYITLCGKAFKEIYNEVSKYKLYSTNYNIKQTEFANVNLLNLTGYAHINNIDNRNNMRLSTFYKLLYNNYVINYSVTTTQSNEMPVFHVNIDKKNSKANNVKRIFSSKQNTLFISAILKTFYKSFALYNIKNSVNESSSLDNFSRSTILPYSNDILQNKNIKQTEPVTNNEFNNKLKVMALKSVKLINKIRRYKKFIKKSINLSTSSVNFNKSFIAYEKVCVRNFLRKAYRKEWLYIRYVKMLLFNNNKYKNPFLLGLKSVVSKLYNKKVEFNFVNLKHLYLNSDILSKAIAVRLRNRKNSLLTVLNKVIALVNIPTINNKWDFNVIGIKSKPKRYPTLNTFITNLLNKNVNKAKTINTYIHNSTDSLYSLLKKIYLNESSLTIESKNLNVAQKNALHSINNKAVFGVRLEAKGRLTKRLTASRSVSKLKYKGSIKNINSSRYGLSSAILKGNLRSNLQYTKVSSKTRNGSFGLKGWVNAF